MKRLISIMVAAFLCCGVQNLSAQHANLNVPSADLASKQVEGVADAIVSAINSKICSSIKGAQSDDGSCGEFCANLSATPKKPTSGEVVNKCMTDLVNNVSLPGGIKLPSGAAGKIQSLGCGVLCNRATCKTAAVQDECGLVCCPLGAGVNNCLKAGPQTVDPNNPCSAYTGKASTKDAPIGG